MKKVEHFLEKLMFASRWIMAPVYIGHLTFVISGVLLAFMDYIIGKTESHS